MPSNEEDQKRSEEQLLEIVARELYVGSHKGDIADGETKARNRWYREASEYLRDRYRQQARWLVGSLAKSELAVTWSALAAYYGAPLAAFSETESLEGGE